MNKLLKTRNICFEIMEYDEIDIEKKKIKQVAIKREKIQSFFKNYKFSTIFAIISVILIILNLIFDLDYFEHLIVLFVKLEEFEIDEVFLIIILISISLLIDLSIQKYKDKEILKQNYNQAEFYKNLLLHDMSNIFFNINSSEKLIEIYRGDPNKLNMVKKMRMIIKQQIQKGLFLLLNIKKLVEVEKEERIILTINIKSMLDRALESIHSQFQGIKIEIINETPQESFYVKGSNLLLNAFENILLNGVVHNDNKIIKIWIELSKIKKDGERFVKLELKDNGIGIDNEKKKVIFNRSSKKEKNRGGMGIGLSLVKKIINSCGGQVQVEDRILGDHTKGSNFIVSLKES